MSEDTGQQITYLCRQLDSLRSHILGRLSHWEALPQATSRAFNYAKQMAESSNITSDERVVALNIVKSLADFASYDEIPFSEIRRLADETLNLLTISRKLTNWGESGSLWNELHSTLQQHTEAAALGFVDIIDGIRRLITDIKADSNEACNGCAAHLSTSLENFVIEHVETASVARLLEGLQNAVDVLPTLSVVNEIHPSIKSSTKRFMVAIIEDNREWQQFVLRCVLRVRQELGNSFSVQTETYSNVEDALTALVDQNRKGSQLTDTDNKDRVELIAIADMGLPANKQESEAILRDETTPSRSNGHRLLQSLRAYRANIPVVVLTTPAYLLEDQLNACAQGIEDCHYMLKGLEKETRLVEVILSIIHRAQSHSIEVWLAPDHEARVDGIPIPLTEMPFRTFYALCLLSSGSRNTGYSLGQILDQLDETFRDDYDYKRPPETAVEQSLVLARQRSGAWWDPDKTMSIANVIRLWAARKAECNGDTMVALQHLRKENFQVWKDGLRLLETFLEANSDQDLRSRSSRVRLDRLDPETLASRFDDCFGGFEGERRSDYELHNLEEHINLIRGGIHTAFKQAHRFIEPRTEILVRRMAGTQYGYRILGQIILHHEGRERSPDEENNRRWNRREGVRGGELPIRVLIVENEKRYLTRIESLLEDAGFLVCVATNEEDAILEARGFQPDIVSLDLHIPATRKLFEDQADAGSAHGGLRVLESIREDLPNVRVVIPTTLFDLDELRERAAELRVPVSDFVPKGHSANGATWEGHLLLTLSRFRQEILSHAQLPALPAWRCPIVHILDGSDLRQGGLNLDVNGRVSRVRQSNQGRLLGLLLQFPGEVVSFSEIDRYVDGTTKVINENTRKQWIKKVRERIHCDWMGLSAENAERPELDILETLDDALVLHAHVEGFKSNE
jgi:CheY-like chemotaxis protein